MINQLEPLQGTNPPQTPAKPVRFIWWSAMPCESIVVGNMASPNGPRLYIVRVQEKGVFLSGLNVPDTVAIEPFKTIDAAKEYAEQSLRHFGQTYYGTGPDPRHAID